jgi:hypothetical protein
MRKSFFTLFIVFVTGVTYAQKDSGFELGVNAGLNSSLVTNANGVRAVKSYTSFNLGLTGEYYFSSSWSIKSKLILDNKGWGNGLFRPVQGGNIVNSNIRMTYLTFPLTASWHFGARKEWYLHVGFYAGFLLSSESESNDIDVSNAIENLDIGLTAGIGYRFSVSNKTKLIIEYDRQEGMTNVFVESTGFTVRNSRNSINVGFSFELN